MKGRRGEGEGVGKRTEEMECMRYGENDRTSELGCAMISDLCGGREMKAAKEKGGVRMGGWE